MTWLWIILAFLMLSVIALMIWRWSDRRTDHRTGRELVAQSRAPERIFDLSMIKNLPEPAQRYFRYSIKEGAPLVLAVAIDMHGELGLGTRDQPKYNAMKARQILAPPFGLVWELKSGAISGSDGATPNASWTRFWLFNVIPIVRVGGGTDHHRSAFGRVVSEGAFWVPASLLPSEYVRWEPVDQTTARAVVSYAAFEQAVEITVAESGQPMRVVIQRWSNENPDRQFREQAFGGELSKFRLFGDYRLPTRVSGGNHIGTEDYFPFYRVNVTGLVPCAENRPGFQTAVTNF